MKNNIKNRELILNDVISLFCTAATSYAKRMTILKANCRLDLPFIEDDTNHPTREFLNCIPADKMGSGSMVVATRKVLYETFKNAFPDLSLIEIFSFNEKYHKYFDK